LTTNLNSHVIRSIIHSLELSHLFCERRNRYLQNTFVIDNVLFFMNIFKKNSGKDSPLFNQNKSNFYLEFYKKVQAPYKTSAKRKRIADYILKNKTQIKVCSEVVGLKVIIDNKSKKIIERSLSKK
jgi:hypothetical protein